MLIRIELELTMEQSGIQGSKGLTMEDILPHDERTIRECIYSYLEELIEDDSLEYVVITEKEVG